MCGINKDASMLRSDDGIDHGRQVVNIGKGLYTEDDIVECTALSAGGSLFGCPDNCVIASRISTTFDGRAHSRRVK